MKKDGFTLVELAIVLVIIGLLIGGILAAKSMIGTSKITATTALIGQFDAGVMNFKTKYNYLPGDAPAVGGDGDSLIDGQSQYVSLFSCESANFWSSMMPESYTSSPSCPITVGVAGLSTGASKNLPASPLGIPGSVFYATAATLSNSSYADLTNLKNFYAIVPGKPLETIACCGRYFLNSTYAVATPDLLALDKKMDDGIANTGNVISGRMTGSGYISIDPSYPVPQATCSTAGTYAPSNAGYNCLPLIRIGGVAGDPQ